MLEEYLQSLGFELNPFQFTNADNESTYLANYFIAPDYFEDVWGSPDNPVSNIVYAPRGGGKTAQRIMIEQRAKKDGNVLTITYASHDLSNYKRIDDVDINYHLQFLNRLLLLAFFSRVEDSDFNFDFTFNHTERQFIYKLARIYLYDTPASFPQQAISSLKTLDDYVVQLWRQFKEPIAGIIKNISKSKGLEVDLSAIDVDKKLEITHRENFINIIHFLKKTGYRSVYILVDKVDEQHLTGNNPEASFQLIEDLVKDLELLETPNVGFKFFLWDALRPYMTTAARPDRVFSYNLRWSTTQLREMLKRRVYTYSSGRVTDFEVMFKDIKSLGRVLLFSEYSPRDCIRICNRILSEQFKDDPEARQFSINVVNRSIEAFCKEKASELIINENNLRYLTKLNRVSFTIEELVTNKLAANTSSVRNIITPWLTAGYLKKIGLVERRSARAVNEYAFQDVRLAFMACPSLGIDDFIKHKVRRCSIPQCKREYYRDFDRKPYSCPDCDTSHQ